MAGAPAKMPGCPSGQAGGRGPSSPAEPSARARRPGAERARPCQRPPEGLRLHDACGASLAGGLALELKAVTGGCWPGGALARLGRGALQRGPRGQPSLTAGPHGAHATQGQCVRP